MVSKKQLASRFVESIYFHCTDRNLPENGDPFPCASYRRLADCLTSAAARLTQKELSVVGHALEGVTETNTTFRLEDRLCLRCQRPVEAPVCFGDDVYCQECTCADCGRELHGYEEQVCRECEGDNNG